MPELRTSLADMATADRLYDGIIYGADVPGIAAAIGAARQGMRILLISTSDRVGGMIGWGGNQMDVMANKTPGMLQGLAREFFSLVAQERQEFTLQRWHRLGGPGRPSYYERAFTRLMAGLPITILYNTHLVSVVKTGTRTSGLLLSDGEIYSAPGYIDGSDTGDLARMRLASTSIGREGDALHGETGAGIQTPTTWPGATPPDPYVTPGNAGSGLLYGLSSAALGTAGAGDGRVMSFCFRLFLTSVPAEKGSWPAPNMSTYDPLKYELLGRAFAADATYWGHSTNALGRLFNIYDVGLKAGSAAMGPTYHSYIDLNSNGPISTDYPNDAECLEYVTATPARRKVIEENAKQWILGLFHWLLNSSDVRIPAALKTAVDAYRPSNIELVKYGGISPQFYVREGCRAVGDYVQTQASAIVANGIPDPIGFGAYGFDCKPIRRLVSSGVAKYEGVFNSALTGSIVGFPIPYRVLLPKASECTDLLVPGAPSVSWYVHTAIRAWPVQLMVGEAAGIALSLAVKAGVAVQDIDRDRLLKIQDLYQLQKGIVISADGTTYSQGTRVESGAGSAFTSFSSRWGFLGAAGKSCPAANARKVKYSPNLFQPRALRVLWLYPTDESTGAGGAGRATNLPVTISHADGTTVRTVNQQYPGGSGGAWDDLGVYYFRSGQVSADYVEIDPTTADGIVTDGGMMFMPV